MSTARSSTPTVHCVLELRMRWRVRRGPVFGRSSAPAVAIAAPSRLHTQLGIDAPLVCNSGAIIKDPQSHRTLWRADFDPSLAADVLRLFDDHDQPAVVFTDRDPVESDFIIRSISRPAVISSMTTSDRTASTPRSRSTPVGPSRSRQMMLCHSSPAILCFTSVAIGSEREMLGFERSP